MTAEALLAILATAALGAVISALGWALKRAVGRVDALERAHSDRAEAVRQEAKVAVEAATAAMRANELAAEEKIEGLQRDVAALQAAQITHQDLGRMYERISQDRKDLEEKMSTVVHDLGEVKGALTGMAAQIGTVTRFLLETPKD